MVFGRQVLMYATGLLFLVVSGCSESQGYVGELGDRVQTKLSREANPSRQELEFEPHLINVYAWDILEHWVEFGIGVFIVNLGGADATINLERIRIEDENGIQYPIISWSTDDFSVSIPSGEEESDQRQL